MMNYYFVLLILSLPHWFYAFVWTQSATFISLVKSSFGTGGQPVKVFASVAYALKIMQFTAVVWYYVELGVPALSDVSLAQVLVGLAVGAVGQVLNAAIYKAIGVNGVYYGVRLGLKVPWVKGFPFNIVAHPQYVGTVLSIWSAAIMLYEGPQHNSLLSLFGFWTLFYGATAWIESNL